MFLKVVQLNLCQVTHLGATSVHEAIYCLIMMKNNFISASANITDLDDEAKNFPIVQKVEKTDLKAVMSNSFGFGGTNATLVLKNLMSLLKDKKGLIMGVANERSIAWGISKKLSNEGADLAFTYVGESLKKRVVPLADSLGSKLTIDCNVENEQQIKDTFTKIKQKWGNIDFVVHSVAFSDKSELSGEYLSTSRNNFLNSMLISCFSFTEVARAAADLMKKGGSLLTLTYESTKVIPNYNVMGVCKSALETSTKYLARDLGKKA